MKPKYYRYELWEDYQNGMYRTAKDGNEQKRISEAVILFRDLKKLQSNMQYVADNWKYSATTKMSDTSNNHQAWLGQASLCYALGCNVYETVEAWRKLTDKERADANHVADIVFEKWKKQYEMQFSGYQYSIFDLGGSIWGNDI